MRGRFIILFLVIVSSVSVVLLKSLSFSVEAQDSLVSLDAWQETALLPGKTHPYPSFALNGRFYVHTHANERDVYMGTPNAAGNITQWVKAFDDHGGIHGFTAVVAGGTAYHFRNG